MGPFGAPEVIENDGDKKKDECAKTYSKDSLFKSDRYLGEESDRQGFVKKVFSIVAVMLSITALFVTWIVS